MLKSPYCASNDWNSCNVVYYPEKENKLFFKALVLQSQCHPQPSQYCNIKYFCFR